jgi:hypothetical protein
MGSVDLRAHRGDHRRSVALVRSVAHGAAVARGVCSVGFNPRIHAASVVDGGRDPRYACLLKQNAVYLEGGTAAQ